jgi:hypothetical protein
MKLILSRKGFDSGTGKVPSPIFPDGTMLSLPIPDKYSKIIYNDIMGLDGRPIGDLVEKLTKDKIPRHYKAHLDPDLRKESLKKRKKGWRPIFGQTGGAQGHLEKHNIGPGDLFLFFGRFRKLKQIDGEFQYKSDAKILHVIFGWLQIGKVVPVKSIDQITLKWACYHPHLARKMNANNTLYIASNHLNIPNLPQLNLSGAGTFTKFLSELQLTAPDSKGCSLWKLPKWFYPSDRRSSLSFHSKRTVWKKKKDCVYLQTVGRGQEFILDCQDYPEALKWISHLIGKSTEKKS